MTRAMLLLPLLAAGCLIEVGGGSTQWDFEDATALEIRLSSGDVTITSTSGPDVEVYWEGGGVGDNARPEVSTDRFGRVRVDANGGLLGGGSIEVALPAGIDVDVQVERGAIDAHLDAPTNIFACTGAGSITLGVAPGPYELDLGVGVGVIDSDVWHEPGAPYTIEVCLGAGDVELYGS